MNYPNNHNFQAMNLNPNCQTRDLEYLKEQLQRQMELCFDVSEALTFLAELAGGIEEDRKASISMGGIAGMQVILRCLAEKAQEAGCCEIYPYDLDNLAGRGGNE